MTRSVTIAEAEALLEELIEQAHAGDQIIITDGGKPVVRLEAVTAESELASSE